MIRSQVVQPPVLLRSCCVDSGLVDIDPEADRITKNRLYEEAGLKQRVDRSFVVSTKHPPTRTDESKNSNAKMRMVVWKNQGMKCANPYCSQRSTIRQSDIELDHRLPKSRGVQMIFPIELDCAEIVTGENLQKAGADSWMKKEVCNHTQYNPVYLRTSPYNET